MRLLALGGIERKPVRVTHTLALLAIELVVWAVAAYAAGSISGRVGRALDVVVDLPSPPLSGRDLSLTFLILVSVHAGILFVAHRALGCEIRISARCMVQELHLAAIALALAAIGVFLFTDIVFNAHWFAAVGLIFAQVMILVFAVLHLARRRPGGAGVPEFSRICLRLLTSPLGLAALALVVASFASAKLYRMNDDFANAVTRLRLLLNTDDDLRPWALVDGHATASFLQPMLLRFAAGEPGVAYLLERKGRLLRIDLAGQREPEIVLDFQNRVGWVEIENGALGFALAPKFGGREHDRLVYVYYTDVDGERQVNRVSRFDLSLAGAAARLASEDVLIELNRDASGFHNGGAIEFGPDGHLYIAIGEATDQRNHQTISRSLFGGVLRIDVETGDGNGHPPPRQPEDGRTAGYHIPEDNPFVGQAGALEEFYAIGVRNPFRMSFDPLTGSLWAGDVGTSHLEEVNRIVKGGNYQFPFAEGNRPMARRPERVIGRETPPVYAYQHTAYERSIIGGLVYRGERYPELNGKYVFADNYSGHVYALDLAGRRTGDRPRPISRCCAARHQLADDQPRRRDPADDAGRRRSPDRSYPRARSGGRCGLDRRCTAARGGGRPAGRLRPGASRLPPVLRPLPRPLRDRRWQRGRIIRGRDPAGLHRFGLAERLDGRGPPAGHPERWRGLWSHRLHATVAGDPLDARDRGGRGLPPALR